MRRTCLSILVTIATLAVGLSAAHATAYAAGQGASGWGTGSIGSGQVGVGVGDSGGGPTPGVPPAPDPPPSAELSYWSVVTCVKCLANGMVCTAAGAMGTVPAGTRVLPLGDRYVLTFYLIVPADPQAGLWSLGCAPPPAPPNATQVWGNVTQTDELPPPQIELNPDEYGVVQLPTWFWLANDAYGVDLRVSVPGGVDGYAVTLTAHPVGYYWSFGDGETALSYTAGSPGEAKSASTVHTYLDKGTFSVGVVVAWAGSYTFSGYGVTQTAALGPVNQPEVARPYVVQEIRSVLVGTGAP